MKKWIFNIHLNYTRETRYPRTHHCWQYHVQFEWHKHFIIEYQMIKKKLFMSSKKLNIPCWRDSFAIRVSLAVLIIFTSLSRFSKPINIPWKKTSIVPWHKYVGMETNNSTATAFQQVHPTRKTIVNRYSIKELY